MTVKQLLDVPTADLAKLTDPQLEELLGPLVPAARQADKDSIVLKETKSLMKQAEHLLGITLVKPVPDNSTL